VETEQPENVVIDTKGRRLKIERLDFLTESRVMRALGDAAGNPHYVLAYVMPAVSVTQIDDLILASPRDLPQIEAAIQRLGREGAQAVLQFYEKQAEANTVEPDALKN
jgi:hypothetical protein